MMIKDLTSALKLNSVFIVLFACVVVFSITPSSSYANIIDQTQNTPLFFNVEPESTNDVMARKVLGNKIQQAEIEVGRKIITATARVDLNNDGVKELFVRLLDPEIFCQGDTCQIYGYAVTNAGLVEIADFKTKTIDINDEMHKNTKTLVLNAYYEDSKIATWNGGKYEIN